MKALVFSTGGAHLTTMLGMLEGLHARGELQDLHACAGISAGAILAAFCATRPIDQAVEKLRDIMIHHYKDAIKPHYKMLNIPLSALFRDSILDDTGLKEILQKELEGKKLLCDLYVGVTNETAMRYEVHSFLRDMSSNSPLTISQAVHASASIPVVLKGEDVEDVHYSDGGVFHQIPVLEIEEMLHKAADDESKHLDLTIVSCSTWNYRPTNIEARLPYLAKKTMHFLDCANYTNLSSDREILRQAIALFKEEASVSLQMFSVPTVLLRKLHQRLRLDRMDKLSETEIEDLQEIGRKIVRASCATYDIAQDEPSPILKF